MAAHLEDIQGWLKQAERQNCTHLIVVCDTFDHEDYPVYVKQGEEVNQHIEHYRHASMQQIMEVYNMSMDLNAQLKERRAYNI